MSDDNKNSEPFDFNFDSLNEEEAQEQSGESFDLDNPFGDDVVVTQSETGMSADNDPLDGDSVSYFSDSVADSSFEDSVANESVESDGEEVPAIDAGEEATDKKKKGLLSGLFGGGKKKAPKEKKAKEKQPKSKKEKKEKVAKDEEATDKPAVPRDWGTILCIAFSVFLLVSLLVFNVAAFLTAESGKIMQTLCFLGAFNIVGLALVAVPVLFYKFPKERTLPNVMLGISVGAMFTGVLFLVNNFYHYYGFAISP